jgi:hypothetical protein
LIVGFPNLFFALTGGIYYKLYFLLRVVELLQTRTSISLYECALSGWVCFFLCLVLTIFIYSTMCFFYICGKNDVQKLERIYCVPVMRTLCTVFLMHTVYCTYCVIWYDSPLYFLGMYSVFFNRVFFTCVCWSDRSKKIFSGYMVYRLDRMCTVFTFYIQFLHFTYNHQIMYSGWLLQKLESTSFVYISIH